MIEVRLRIGATDGRGFTACSVDTEIDKQSFNRKLFILDIILALILISHYRVSLLDIVANTHVDGTY